MNAPLTPPNDDSTIPDLSVPPPSGWLADPETLRAIEADEAKRWALLPYYIRAAEWARYLEAEAEYLETEA